MTTEHKRNGTPPNPAESFSELHRKRKRDEPSGVITARNLFLPRSLEVEQEPKQAKVTRVDWSVLLVLALAFVVLVFVAMLSGCSGFPQLVSVEATGTASVTLHMQAEGGGPVYVQRIEVAEVGLDLDGEPGPDAHCEVIVEVSLNGLVLSAGALPTSDELCFEEAGGPYRPFRLGLQPRQLVDPAVILVGGRRSAGDGDDDPDDSGLSSPEGSPDVGADEIAPETAPVEPGELVEPPGEPEPDEDD